MTLALSLSLSLGACLLAADDEKPAEARKATGSDRPAGRRAHKPSAATGKSKGTRKPAKAHDTRNISDGAAKSQATD
jgi:hypothetical protein